MLKFSGQVSILKSDHGALVDKHGAPLERVFLLIKPSVYFAADWLEIVAGEQVSNVQERFLGEALDRFGDEKEIIVG